MKRLYRQSITASVHTDRFYRYTLFKILIIAFLSFIIIPGHAQETGSPYQFIYMSPSPRIFSLGNSGLSLAEPGFSFYYNPAVNTSFYLPEPAAGFSYTPDTYQPQKKFSFKTFELAINYARYLKNLNHISFFWRFSLERAGEAGIGLITLLDDYSFNTSYAERRIYPLIHQPDFTFPQSGSYAVILNYAYPFFHFFQAGMNFKILKEESCTVSCSSSGLDIGFVYTRNRFGLGLVVQNINSLSSREEDKKNLAAGFDIGGHYLVRNKQIQLTPEDRILLTFRNKISLQKDLISGLGIEYSYRGLIFFRLGYQNSGFDHGFKTGAGVLLNPFQADYAFNRNDLSGTVHRISLSYKLSLHNQSIMPIEQQKAANTLFNKSRRGLEIGIQNNLLFGSDQTTLARKAPEILNKILAHIRRLPTYKIRIEGNAGGEEGEVQNREISLKQAEAVSNYLAAHGAGTERLEIAGLGSDNPVIPGEGTGEVQANNRIDIILIRLTGEKRLKDFIDELPRAERARVEKQYYFGLDCYYKEDYAAAIQHWKEIRTENQELKAQLQEKILSAETELQKVK